MCGQDQEVETSSTFAADCCKCDFGLMLNIQPLKNKIPSIHMRAL